MVKTLKEILDGVLVRLDRYATTVLPSLLAALVLILGAWFIASAARWLLRRAFKGPAIDRFLRQSGVAFMLDPRGRLRATRLVAETVYWSILIAGFLLGLSVFDSDITSLMVRTVVALLPKIVVAGLILLAGAWFSQYLGRTTVVWAVNEGLPTPRRLAAAVRVVIMFVAIVVAADQLDFARHIFFAAFLILVGGAVLTASLAIGLNARGGFRHYFEERGRQPANSEERSLWHHL